MALAEQKQAEGYHVMVTPSFMYRPFSYYFAPDIFRNPTEIHKQLYARKVYFIKTLDATFFDYTDPEKVMLCESHLGVIDKQRSCFHELSARYSLISQEKFKGVKVSFFEKKK